MQLLLKVAGFFFFYAGTALQFFDFFFRCPSYQYGGFSTLWYWD